MERSIRSDENLTGVVIRAVADMTDRDPTDLQPLADSVDPDALHLLVNRSSDDGFESLTLVYEGYRITIDRETVQVQENSDSDRS